MLFITAILLCVVRDTQCKTRESAHFVIVLRIKLIVVVVVVGFIDLPNESKIRYCSSIIY